MKPARPTPCATAPAKPCASRRERRVELQERIILRGLARIEPDDVEEKSPRHDSWPCPDQPCGSQNNEHRRELIEQQNHKHPSVVWPLSCNDIDFSCWSIRGGSHHEFGAPLISDEAKASQGGHRTRASQSVRGNAAHLLEIEPVAHTQTGLKSGGIRLSETAPVHR